MFKKPLIEFYKFKSMLLFYENLHVLKENIFTFLGWLIV